MALSLAILFSGSGRTDWADIASIGLGSCSSGLAIFD